MGLESSLLSRTLHVRLVSKSVLLFREYSKTLENPNPAEEAFAVQGWSSLAVHFRPSRISALSFEMPHADPKRCPDTDNAPNDKDGAFQFSITK